MKNNIGLLIIIFVCLATLGLVYLTINVVQNTEEPIELEPQTKTQKPIPVANSSTKSDQINSKDKTDTNNISNTKNDTDLSYQQEQAITSEIVVKEKNITTPVTAVPVKPISEMTEEELTEQLQIKNEPELLIEAVNRLSLINKISDKSIDQLKGFIGKKNADVDAYLIKALSKKATNRDDVLSDFILLLKTSNNKVIKRCAADAIGEFKNSKQKLTELNSILENETDERVKLKLNQTIRSINDTISRQN